MLCALETQTVIKTFCLRLAVPTCWIVSANTDIVVFETLQIMTTQPCAINVDQLRVMKRYLPVELYR